VYNAAGHIYRTPYATKLNLAYYNGLHLYCSQTLTNLVTNTFNMPGAFFTDGFAGAAPDIAFTLLTAG
jgi:hypothetical protein